MTGTLTPLEEDLLAALDPREIAAYQQILTASLPTPGDEAAQDRAVAFIRRKLRSWGVPTTIHRFDALVSVPGPARLSLARRDAPVPALVLPYSPATPAGGLVAELRAATPDTAADGDLAGMVALIDGPPTAATVARIAAWGAVAQVYIAAAETLVPVPVAAADGGPAPTPVVTIGRAAGEGFLALGAAGATPVRLSVETGWARCQLALPVATIRGVEEPETFVLLGASGPAPGAGGEAAACLLEFCRVLAEQAGRLRRGVRCAWWPQGALPATGPRWYTEHAWEDLGRHAACYVELATAEGRQLAHLAAWGGVALRPFAESALRDGGVRAVAWDTGAARIDTLGPFARRGLPALRLAVGQAGALGAGVPTVARLCTVPLLPCDVVATARAIEARLRAILAVNGDALDLAPLRARASAFLAASERLQLGLLHIAQADSPHYEEGLELGNRALRRLDRLLVPLLHHPGDPYATPTTDVSTGSVHSNALLPGLDTVLTAAAADGDDLPEGLRLRADAIGARNRLLDALNAGVEVSEEVLAALRPLGFG